MKHTMFKAFQVITISKIHKFKFRVLSKIQANNLNHFSLKADH